MRTWTTKQSKHGGGQAGGAAGWSPTGRLTRTPGRSHHLCSRWGTRRGVLPRERLEAARARAAVAVGRATRPLALPLSVAGRGGLRHAVSVPTHVECALIRRGGGGGGGSRRRGGLSPEHASGQGSEHWSEHRPKHGSGRAWVRQSIGPAEHGSGRAWARQSIGPAEHGSSRAWVRQSMGPVRQAAG